MIDTTQLPPEIQASLADHQPMQWIPLPVGPGMSDMSIPVKTHATPRLLEPWQLDLALTTPAVQVYRLVQENLAAIVHLHTVSLVHASDPQTLTNTLTALSDSRQRSRTADPDRDNRPLERAGRSR